MKKHLFGEVNPQNESHYFEKLILSSLLKDCLVKKKAILVNNINSQAKFTPTRAHFNNACIKIFKYERLIVT